MELLLRKVVFCIFFLVKLCVAEEDELPYDFPDINAEKVVCSAMAADPADMKVGVEGPIEYEDALKLLSWNIKYSFKSGDSSLTYGGETDWKRPVLDAIFEIFSRSCPPQYVPRSFLNVLKETNLIYQNSIQNKSDNSAKWETVLQSLTDCSGKVLGGDYSGTGRNIERVSLQSHNGNYETIDLHPPTEIVDRAPQIDLIIDGMWFAFSNSYAACYKKMSARANANNNYKKLFIEDFLNPFLDRWLNVGPGVDFGIMLGDFPIDRTLINMRYCVTGTYMKAGLVDRQLIRPVIMGPEYGKPMHNKKTGLSLARNKRV